MTYERCETASKAPAAEVVGYDELLIDRPLQPRLLTVNGPCVV
jgi:hypothetical protein